MHEGSAAPLSVVMISNHTPTYKVNAAAFDSNEVIECATANPAKDLTGCHE